MSVALLIEEKKKGLERFRSEQLEPVYGGGF
jgi:hypothetical protein